MDRFPTWPTCRHPGARPALGVPDALGIIRREQGLVEPVSSGKGPRGGKEPGFALALRQHDANVPIPSRGCRPLQERGARSAGQSPFSSGRTTMPPSASARAEASATARSPRLPFGHNPVTRHAGGSGRIRDSCRRNPLRHATEQDGDGFDLAMTLDDRLDPPHVSWPGACPGVPENAVAKRCPADERRTRKARNGIVSRGFRGLATTRTGSRSRTGRSASLPAWRLRDPDRADSAGAVPRRYADAARAP